MPRVGPNSQVSVPDEDTLDPSISLCLKPLPLPPHGAGHVVPGVNVCLQERDLEALVRRFKTDLHNCVAYIQDPRLLKEKIRSLFEKYVQRADMVRALSAPPLPSHTALCWVSHLPSLAECLPTRCARWRLQG